ncbi:protein sidekick-like isoform X3 [Acropora palmata]
MREMISALIGFLVMAVSHQADSNVTIAAPINVTVSERNEGNLTVVWSPVSSSVDILGYRIRYRRNDTQAFKFHVMNCTSQPDQIGNESISYSMSSFNSIFVCSNRTSVSLTNLTVYTFYWIDVTAFGNSSFGTRSSPIISPTSEAAPSSPPVNVSVVVHNSTAISVAWDPVPKEHRNGKIISYLLILDENGLQNHPKKDPICGEENEVNVVDEDESENVTVDRLRKFTTYNVSVTANTSAGSSRPSDVINVTTSQDAPDGAPRNLTAINRTSDSITISWGPVEDNLINGVLIGYKIFWKEVASNVNDSMIVKWNETEHRKKRDIDTVPAIQERIYSITNLTVYTNYSVQIAAYTVALGPYSNETYLMSGEGVPTSAPRNVTAYNTSAHSIKVEWIRPDEDRIHGILAGYDVTFTLSHNASAIRRTMICGANTSVVLTNLPVYTLFNITVSAFTKVGIGNRSGLIQARTDETEPTAPPENFTAISLSFNSINVSWKPVPEEHRRGIIIGYQVKVQGNNGSQFLSFGGSKSSGVIRNLRMFVYYKLCLLALTRIGGGPCANRTLQTKITAPTVIPLNVTANLSCSTCVNVMWAIEGLERGFILQSYVVSYKALKNVTWKSVYVPANQTSTVLQSLKIYTTYEIKVAAVTGNLTGDFSVPINVTSSEGAPDSPPLNVRVVPLSFTSVRVKWDKVPETKRNGIIRGYTIQWRGLFNGSWSLRNITVYGEDNLTVVIEGLEMFVTYKVKALASTTAGSGGFSSPVDAITNQTMPEVQLKLDKPTPQGNKSIVVRWNVKYDKRLNEPRHFHMRFCPVKNCGNYSSQNFSNTKNATISDLVTYAEYKFQIRAVNITAIDGTNVLFPEGNFSEPVSGRTDEGVPAAEPSNVKAKAESSTSIKVTWGELPWDKVHANITHYFIQWFNRSSQQSEGNVTVSSNIFQYVIEDLEVYKNYSVQVKAIAKSGSGPFSDLVNTTTHLPAPHLVPANMEVVATGQTTIRVTWDRIDTANITGFRGYKIEYVKLSDDSNGSLLVGDVTNATLRNLKIFTEYKIKVAARSSQPGNYTPSKTVKTHEGVPSKAPTNLKASVLDSISARISWGHVPTDYRNGIIKGYRVFYKRGVNGTYKNKTTVWPAKTLLLLNLDKAAEYNCTVLAFTGTGDGTKGDFTFKTGDDIPSRPPVEVKAISRISPTTLNVTWKPVPPEFRHGTVLEYSVKYQRVKVGDEKIEDDNILTIKVVRDKNFVELTGLNPYVEYKVSVAANTQKGTGPYAFATGETCRCGRKFTTSWRRYEPYANVTDDGKPGQIIPSILQRMVDECCGSCDAYERTVVDFKTDGLGKKSEKNSNRFLLESLDTSTDFTFPVHGNSLQDSYKGGYGYVPVIESSGVAFIVSPNASETQSTTFALLMRCLPVLLLPMVTASAAGIVIWIGERTHNPNDFNPSFIEGSWAGLWWAFVTMTTLGYGDRAPLSFYGRTFAVSWISFGLVVISITMAMITTTLTTTTLKSTITIYGTKVAAEYNSPEYHLGTRRNAKYESGKEYHSMEEITQALFNREVKGILVDAYSAGLRNDLFSRPEFRVNEIVDYKTAYGIVLSPNARPLRKCFQSYLTAQRAELFDMIKDKIRPIQTSNSTKDEEKSSGRLLDSSSPQFRNALRYASVSLGVALFFSLIYEV